MKSNTIFTLLLILTLSLSGTMANATSYTTKVTQDSTHSIVDEMPTFPGGEKAMMSFIKKHLRYPKIAQEAEAQGRIAVRFLVTNTGEVKETEIIRSDVEMKNKKNKVTLTISSKSSKKKEKKTYTIDDLTKILEEESLRIVRGMPIWKPGIKDGENVSVYFTIPFSFKL